MDGVGDGGGSQGRLEVTSLRWIKHTKHPERQQGDRRSLTASVANESLDINGGSPKKTKKQVQVLTRETFQRSSHKSVGPHWDEPSLLEPQVQRKFSIGADASHQPVVAVSVP